MPEVVGFVHGEVKPTSFDILVENKRLAENGVYIKIHHEMYGWVLGQISYIRRNWDDRRGVEKILARVRIIGYKDAQGIIRLPKTPFKPEERVFRAHQALTKSILGLDNCGAAGLYVGTLDGEDGIKVFLDANKLIQKHLSVLAKTGAGKSYTVGVLLEELADKEVPCVIIDPHGEYYSLKVPNNNPKDMEKFARFGVSPKGFGNVMEYTPDLSINPRADHEFKLSDKNMEAREILDILPVSVTAGQQALLYQAVNELKGAISGDYNLEYIIGHLQLSDTNAKWGLIAGMQSLLDTNIFSSDSVTLEDIAKKGQMTIINLKGIKPEMQELVVAKLAKDLFAARKQDKVPAFFMLIEEAHRFCPERGVGTAMSLPILRTVAAEGRKFGMGLGIVTQRPAKVDKNVLSQANTQIILKVTNPNDINAISKSLENFTPELEDMMKNLVMGTALLSSENLERPVLTNIRVRRSMHGGAAVDLIKTRAASKGIIVPKKSSPPAQEEKSEGIGANIIKKVPFVGNKDSNKSDAPISQEAREREEWKENLTPDEMDYLKAEKKTGITVRSRFIYKIKGFFIEEDEDF